MAVELPLGRIVPFIGRVLERDRPSGLFMSLAALGGRFLLAKCRTNTLASPFCPASCERKHRPHSQRAAADYYAWSLVALFSLSQGVLDHLNFGGANGATRHRMCLCFPCPQ